MSKGKSNGVAPALPEGARSATGGEAGAAGTEMGAVKHAGRLGGKREVVLRLLRGESIDALSRELAVEIYRLERWRERALAGLDAGLKEREHDPLEAKLDEANRRIGELSMEIEILRRERQARHPLARRRCSR